jgi:GT2 family glycosyltransferase
VSTPEGSAGAPSVEVLLANLQAIRLERRRLEREVDRLEATLVMQQRAIERIQGSLGWRLQMAFRMTRDRVFAGHSVARAMFDRAFGRGKRQLAQNVTGDPYAAWVAAHTPSQAKLALMQEESAVLPHTRFSLIVPVGDVAHDELRRLVKSVRAQVWGEWELLLVDAARAPQLQDALMAATSEDGRIRVERFAQPGGRAVALARGIATASGDLVVFLDPGDQLAPEALYEIALELETTPEADVFYADEDEADADGRRSDPVFKPEWSPDLLLSMPYLGKMVAFRRSLLDAVGGTVPADGAEEWDLALRATERARRIVHLPKVLYHACDHRDVARVATAEAGRRVVMDALARRGVEGRVEPTERPVQRVRYTIGGAPLVSLIIPTRDKAAVLRACVESIEARTTWPRRELLIVDNGSTKSDAQRYLTELARRHRVLRDRRSFNWSALNNAAAREASGEYLLFMNNDMEVLAPDWIEALLEQAQRSEVGVVGAKLLYPDRTVQHAGVVLGIGVADHCFKRLPDEAPSYCWLAHAVRDVSAVTGACMMVRRETFVRLGGFDERLRVAFNDIDFCLRARAQGFLVVYTPFATLIHHESVSRRALHPPEDEALMWARWRATLLDDPYYSPHLTRERTDYSVRV